MSGHRTYLGAATKTTDNGRALDRRAVRGIKDPRHPLHARMDPYRYSMDNPEFSTFVEYIVENGPPPQPAMFRKAGLLDEQDPAYRYLLKTYPEKVAEHPEQPILELVYGNRRFYGLEEAEKIWAKTHNKKFAGANLLAIYKDLSDAEMAMEFELENANRARPSILEDHLTVRALIAQNQEWKEIAKRLVQPEKEVRRTHNPLLEAHLAVVGAYSAGSVPRGKVLRIISTINDKKTQVDALEDDSLIPAKPTKQKKDKLTAPPADALRELLNFIRDLNESDIVGLLAAKRHEESLREWAKDCGLQLGE